MQIHVHGNNLASLHKQIPPRLLPAQLGGERGEYSTEVWAETVSKNMIIKPNKEKVDGEEDSKIIKATMENILKKERQMSLSKIKVGEDADKVDENDNNSKKEKVRNSVNVVESKDDSSSSSEDEFFNGESDLDNEEEEPAKTSLKDLKLEQLIRPGMRQFTLAQTTDQCTDTESQRKINKSSSVEETIKHSSPIIKESSNNDKIFSFSKSKSFSFSFSKRGSGNEILSNINSKDLEEEEEHCESDRIYNDKSTKAPSSSSFATNFTNSLALNMSKIGVNIRTKDGGGNYECANNLLSNDTH